MSAADINPFVDLVIATGSAPQQTYTWDAENRLVRVEPTPGTEQAGNYRTEFAYDYLGRRVEKKVYVRNAGNTAWVLGRHSKYVWTDWLLLLELNGLQSNSIVRKHTWGLDLAGQNGATLFRDLPFHSPS